MRRLILMRHAKAEDLPVAEDGSDSDRPLSSRGRRDARAAGELLSTGSQRPQLALVSTALRTRGTWDALCVGLGVGLGVDADPGQAPEVWFDRALYEAGPPAVVELLAAVDAEVQSVLVIGHNPTVSIVAAAFSDGQATVDFEATVADGLPTAAMAFFDVPVQWEDVNAGRLRLTGVEVPRG